MCWFGRYWWLLVGLASLTVIVFILTTLARRLLLDANGYIAFFSALAAFGTWLYQIALNYCRSYLRRKRFFTVPWLSDGIDSPPLPDNRPGPEKHALRREYQQVLWQAVQKLSETLREVVILHYYMEIPAVEIAQMLDCPEGTIYSRLHNARRRLSQLLTENGLNTADLFEVQNAH